jgi:hypothetical protein
VKSLNLDDQAPHLIPAIVRPMRKTAINRWRALLENFGNGTLKKEPGIWGDVGYLPPHHPEYRTFIFESDIVKVLWSTNR